MHGVLCVFMRSAVNLEYIRDKVKARDGSYIYIDWAANKNTPDDAPIVVVLPGAAGNSQSVYVTQFIKHIVDTKNYRAAVMVYQGCDLTTKTNTPRLVLVEDVAETINYISSKYKRAPIIGLGHSFGATLLVKYLGIVKENTPMLAALSLSNPWNLRAISKNIKRGLLARGYELHMLDEFKRVILANKDIFEKTGKFHAALNAKTVEEFHENFCCPVHGFDNLDMYYKHYNSDNVVDDVKIPLFVLHALDDPIVPSYVIPIAKLQKNPYLEKLVVVVTQVG